MKDESTKDQEENPIELIHRLSREGKIIRHSRLHGTEVGTHTRNGIEWQPLWKYTDKRKAGQ